MNTILMSAVLFRFRGSKLFQEITGRGATTARLLWSFHLSFSIYLVSAIGLGWLAGLWLALWLGSVGGWWQSLGVRTWREVAKHSLRGVLWMAPAAGVVYAAGSMGDWPVAAGIEPWALWTLWAAPLLVGALAGPVYWLCRVAWPALAVEAAELVWGSMIAASLMIPIIIKISEKF